MKTINITKKTILQTPKEFCMGNGQRLKFSSKREAIYFIAKTNRFLTKCLVIINETYTDVHAQYRAMWLVGTNYNAGTRTQYIETQRFIQSHLHSAEVALDKFNFTNTGSNDPYFGFIDLRKAALFISEAAEALEMFNEARNLTYNKHVCGTLKERCLLTIKSLNEYAYVKQESRTT